MNKKFYEAPEMETIEMQSNMALLAGSDGEGSELGSGDAGDY